MNDHKGFWDSWARRYDRLMSGEQATYAQVANRMKRKLNRNMVVLELACGTGILSLQLVGRVAAGSHGFFGRNDSAGKTEMPFHQTAFFRTGRDSASLCAAEL